MDWDPLTDREWVSMSGNESHNIIDWVKPMMIAGNVEVNIGTDAQAKGKRVDFVTVVAVHNIGHGGRVFSTKSKDVKVGSLYQKLMCETLMSIEVALGIMGAFPEDDQVEMADMIKVHVDANPNEKYKSSDHVKSLAGMVSGSGFKYILKPNAWAASHAADHVVKNKNQKDKSRRQRRKR